MIPVSEFSQGSHYNWRTLVLSPLLISMAGGDGRTRHFLRRPISGFRLLTCDFLFWLALSHGFADEALATRQAEGEKLRERIQALALLLGHLKALCEDLKVQSGPEGPICDLCSWLFYVTSF